MKAGGLRLGSVVEALPSIVLVLIGGFLVSAGVAKAHNSYDLRSVLLFDGFSRWMIPPLVWSVVLSEIVLGLLLFFRIAQKTVAIITIAVLVLYSLQLGYLLAFTNSPSCACLGRIKQYQSGRTTSSLGLARNSLMIGSLLWVMYVDRLRSKQKPE
jgi:uncharacterized membrane protein YphA (DoxX/SURF4 family)